ncbi:MAG: Kelch repeat-containing protein [Actinomycetia bacterium]|nr:Kelch repeat-containing protein [Actinomycetes bacterium]
MILACVVAAILTLSIRPGSSGRGKVSVDRNHSTTHRSSAGGPVAARFVAASADWHLGSPISRAIAFSDGSGILVAGGLDPGQNTVSTVVHIDPRTGATTSAGSLAVPAHDAAGGAIGAKRFVFGGGAQHVSDVVQALQPNGASTVVGHLPQPRADLASATIGSTVYLIGGYDGTTATRDVLATSDGVRFRTVAQLPVGVRYPAVAALGNSIFVFGGELAGSESSAVQQIDVRTGSARVRGQLPSPRTEAAATTLGGSIYILGGLASGATSSDVLRFDPRSAQFSFDGQLPTPISEGAIVTIGANTYLLGGETPAVSPGVTVLRQTTTPARSPASAVSVRPFAGRLLIADRGNNRLIVVDANKQRSWVYPSATRPPPPGGFYFPDDGFFADHGRSIVTNQEENHTIVRIAFPSGALQWTYGQPKVAGSAPGLLNQPDDAFLLADGTYTVADAKNCRILHISASGHPLSQIGTTGNCAHDPPRSVGYPNGDTPLSNGDLLVSEINGSWVTEYTPAGALVWTVHLPITYPSDPQQLGPDLYLVSDYAKPGGILEFTREGRIVWTYRPPGGEGMLDHPSLAERIPNGLIAVNDDYRHRVAFIDPATNAIVWQYGQTDQPGTGPDQLNIPDGFDLLLPDNSTPTHPPTG